MNAPTPEQMRALVSEVHYLHRQNAGDADRIIRIGDALHAAADKLEAIEAILDEPWEYDHDDAYYLDMCADAESRMRQILTAGTAPQEDRVE